MSEIYGFMHVAVMNHWDDVVLDQIRKIKKSGLYEKTTKIFVSIVGPDKKFDFLRDKFCLAYRDHDLESAELPIMNKIVDFSNRNPDSKIWYIHTKGVSKQLHNAVEDWRRYMEYFIIEKHEDCIDALNNYDACGVNWARVDDPIMQGIYGDYTVDHFNGNFWWANAKYLKSLPYLDVLGDRWQAERFIGANDPNVKCFWSSNINHYKTRFMKPSYFPVVFS